VKNKLKKTEILSLTKEKVVTKGSGWLGKMGFFGFLVSCRLRQEKKPFLPFPKWARIRRPPSGETRNGGFWPRVR